jgi:hypothetical protein
VSGGELVDVLVAVQLKSVDVGFEHSDSLKWHSNLVLRNFLVKDTSLHVSM